MCIVIIDMLLERLRVCCVQRLRGCLTHDIDLSHRPVWLVLGREVVDIELLFYIVLIILVLLVLPREVILPPAALLVRVGGRLLLLRTLFDDDERLLPLAVIPLERT